MNQTFRFLHSSDWHLGQNFMGKSRAAEHQQFFQWLITTVQEQRIDAVIVAGDIFDTGTPPSYARTLYNDFVEAMLDANCQLVIVAGNHDSPATLRETQRLFARLNIHVVPAVAENPKDLVIPLKDQTGDTAALLCGLPFIRARDLVTMRSGMTGEDMETELKTQIQAYYQRVYEVAQEQANGELPIIGTGHLTTFGASLSESVRDIYVGTLKAFPSDAFPPFDYLALGHIHRPQQVGKNPHFRYSGSPIPLSFDEVNTTKQVMVGEFGSNQELSLTSLDVPRFQAMQVIEGNLAEIERQLGAIPDDCEPLWVEIKVIDDGYLEDLHSRFQRWIGDKPVEVLRVMRNRTQSLGQSARRPKQTLSELSHQEVFQRRLAAAQLDEENQQQMQQLYDEIMTLLDEERQAGGVQ